MQSIYAILISYYNCFVNSCTIDCSDTLRRITLGLQSLRNRTYINYYTRSDKLRRLHYAYIIHCSDTLRRIHYDNSGQIAELSMKVSKMQQNVPRQIIAVRHIVVETNLFDIRVVQNIANQKAIYIGLTQKLCQVFKLGLINLKLSQFETNIFHYIDRYLVHQLSEG